jgi:hypothetical protein
MNLAPTATDVTATRARAGLRSAALAGATDDRGLHRQLSFGTEDGLREVDLDLDQGVLTPTLA